MEGFTHIYMDLDTDASGSIEVEAGITCDFSRDDRPFLLSIDEVSVDGGPWLSLKELQASGLRTLTTEVVDAVERHVEDNDDLWDNLIEDAHERAIDDAAEASQRSWDARHDY